jgi:thiol-disulfide isomerase/thioredoxin
MKIRAIFKVTIMLLSTLWLTALQAEGSEYYVGEISAQEILLQFSSFSQHSDDANYLNSDLSTLNQLKGGIQVKVFFGQWCHDSVREVPRVITLLKQVNNPHIKSWFYALNTSKSDPLLLAEKHNILKTPTIIVYKDGVELGRILEVPEQDWATDITAFFKTK